MRITLVLGTKEQADRLEAALAAGGLQLVQIAGTACYTVGRIPRYLLLPLDDGYADPLKSRT
jgi:hypothetical protein